jgi:hypothetical protein
MMDVIATGIAILIGSALLSRWLNPKVMRKMNGRTFVQRYRDRRER